MYCSGNVHVPIGSSGREICAATFQPLAAAEPRPPGAGPMHSSIMPPRTAPSEFPCSSSAGWGAGMSQNWVGLQTRWLHTFQLLLLLLLLPPLMPSFLGQQAACALTSAAAQCLQSQSPSTAAWGTRVSSSALRKAAMPCKCQQRLASRPLRPAKHTSLADAHLSSPTPEQPPPSCYPSCSTITYNVLQANHKPTC